MGRWASGLANDERSEVTHDRPSCGASDQEPAGGVSIQTWRLVVLFGLNALIVTHIVLQKLGLTTYGHTDPLSFRKFIEAGAVTIGLILLVVWLISIPIFGRVLCGWFCHMGAWQELGSWILSKLPFVRSIPGIQPHRIVHSRWIKWVMPSLACGSIVLVSLLRANEMDVGFSEGISWSRETGQPVWPNGPLKTVLLLFTYIFLINGVFGSRALCRYGCFLSPVFRPLQRFSLFRIRKVAECTECGDCNRVCIMGIDVMYEVQRFGHVRDLDCVRCCTCVKACRVDSIRYRAWGTTPQLPAVAVPASLPAPLLPVRVEIGLLLLALLGFTAGVPGVIWGSSFLLSIGGIGVAVLQRVRARFVAG